MKTCYIEHINFLVTVHVLCLRCHWGICGGCGGPGSRVPCPRTVVGRRVEVAEVARPGVISARCLYCRCGPARTPLEERPTDKALCSRRRKRRLTRTTRASSLSRYTSYIATYHAICRQVVFSGDEWSSAADSNRGVPQGSFPGFSPFLVLSVTNIMIFLYTDTKLTPTPSYLDLHLELSVHLSLPYCMNDNTYMFADISLGNDIAVEEQTDQFLLGQAADWFSANSFYLT